MNRSEQNTLDKSERVCGQALTSKLFNGGCSKSMTMYPLRMVYMQTDSDKEEYKARILISVPKRLLHHAVDRNRVKRQIREAYRKNKQIITNKISGSNIGDVTMAFIWTDYRLHPSDEIERKVTRLLQRLEERL